MKRLFDVFVSAFTLFVFSPLLLLIAILIRFKLGSPVLFRQERAGLRGKPFFISKFRTMTGERDADGLLLPDAERITPFGTFLRSTSLDELPELVNVLRGDMSLVGPRPLPTRYLPRYSKKQGRRHDVVPGLTGWAQINGRNSQTWAERFECDLWYVENQSFALDLKIIWQTVAKVISRDGINAEGEATMSEFTGSDESQ
ncbi:sugar transferase [Rubellicoccus peritrichatus]|uniref:Sugar transferase n=1 Tax=Rubellicoccus peritrichatus TaxID=3080537 RepID=A0AAQ3LIU7_9BACT|nr:sugar transferase [Puniceicoccus sp. CR14]WOO42934.1 sugar transferase [Puniceicoccus sp. CR14]